MLTFYVYLYTYIFMKETFTQPSLINESNSTQRTRIYRQLAAGKLQRVLPGVMVDSETMLTDADVMGLLHVRQPSVIMNLISALSYHDMTTQIPDALSVAIPRGMRVPLVHDIPVQVWYTKPELLRDCSMLVQGEFGEFRVTTPERTLIDCFKYRNKIGLSIFLEAARLGQGKLNPTLLHHEAERLRVLNNILPYLKSYFS